MRDGAREIARTASGGAPELARVAIIEDALMRAAPTWLEVMAADDARRAELLRTVSRGREVLAEIAATPPVAQVGAFATGMRIARAYVAADAAAAGMNVSEIVAELDLFTQAVNASRPTAGAAS